MKRIFSFTILFYIQHLLMGQNTFRAIIKDEETQESLAGVNVFIKEPGIGASGNDTGLVEIFNIPDGEHTITISLLGYELQEVTYTFPLAQNEIPVIFLHEDEHELEEVIISSTRTSRSVENTPTRVETIEAEEIDEKSNMRPSNISMLLHESTGIQVQQTSATSANASIRIQGLDGRYAQLLKDGFPNFGNFASGLSVLEIPPLDLKQVEVIKGPASTLYGGGAIAGVVNFISKTPDDGNAKNFLINQSHIGQTNIGTYLSEKYKKVGYTFSGIVNLQQPYDVDEDDFTELPESTDFTVHPKLFIYPGKHTTVIIGNSFTQGDRTGGDIIVINQEADSAHTYFEKNNSMRNNATLEIDHEFSERTDLQLKSGYSYFTRTITLPDYFFEGTNGFLFNELSLKQEMKNQVLIAGVNYLYDDFTNDSSTTSAPLDLTTQTAGIYVQHTWDATQKIKLESGLRGDAVSYQNALYANNEFFILPRISALFKFNNIWSSRIGGGMGYKSPSLFTEETESFNYVNLLPLNGITSEKSIGGTADVYFKKELNEDLYLSVNQLFFYTRITNASILQMDSSDNYFFVNSPEPVTSQGFETNMRFIFKEDFKLFAGYTFTDAKALYLPGDHIVPLQPKHKINLALIYEVHEKIKAGIEGYYTGTQFTSDGEATPTYWEFGAMVEKIWPHISVYINAENFTDTRQSNYGSLVSGAHDAPVFDEIWTHTEGFVLSAGVKIRL